MAEALHVLPLAGGLFDQPAGYITRMESVIRAKQEQESDVAKRTEAQQRAAQRARELADQ